MNSPFFSTYIISLVDLNLPLITDVLPVGWTMVMTSITIQKWLFKNECIILNILVILAFWCFKWLKTVHPRLSGRLMCKEPHTNFAWKHLLMLSLFQIFTTERWQECQRPWNVFMEGDLNADSCALDKSKHRTRPTVVAFIWAFWRDVPVH